MAGNKNPSIFVAILNMGLGHATRSLTIIRCLASRGWNIYIGASGRSRLFLQNEFPGAQYIDLPDYALKYSRRGVQIPRLLAGLPATRQAIAREHFITEQLVWKYSIDLILSDHRYGCYSRNIPSYFLSHQLRFIAPSGFRAFEPLGLWFNRFYHRRYRGVIIPDEPADGEGLLSGRLSRHPSRPACHFCGILSSIQTEKTASDIDVLISISGPEPLRSVFESKIRAQLEGIPGQIVVGLGKPESDQVEQIGQRIVIYHHLSRKQMQNYLNRSKLVVTRSGYSTLMELAELGKKALLIPTPGQTEQVYLAERLKKSQYFHAVPQGEFNLLRDIPVALQYSGLPGRYRSSRSLRRLMEILEAR